MKIALIVPGGVDRTGEVRVIPVFIALIRRLAARHELHVFALRQEDEPGTWRLAGATVHNAGSRQAALRMLVALWAEHRRQPFVGLAQMIECPYTPRFESNRALERL